MNSDEASKLIMVSGGVTMASVFMYKAGPKSIGGQGFLKSGSLPPKYWAGTAVVYFGLSAMAGVAPDVAGGLAAAIMWTAFSQYGIPVLLKTFTGQTAESGAGSPPDTFVTDVGASAFDTASSTFHSAVHR